MKYKWLFFDLDNTLMDFDQSAKMALQKSFEDFDIPYEEQYVQKYYQVNKKCWEAFERKEFTAQQIREERFAIFLNEIEMERDGIKMGKIYLEYLGSFHYMLEGAYSLLDVLKKSHQLVAVTNGLKEVQRPRLRDAKLYTYFESVVISDEIGISKPHTGFFDFTFKQVGHPNKKEVLMIGDSLNSDILGGYNYGLDTCWYNPKKVKNTKSIEPTYEISVLNDLLAIA